MRRIQQQIISWPLGGTDPRGRLAWAADVESVRDVIWNILMTRPGERLMRPEFGAGLTDYVHQPNNATTRSLIADVIKRSITRWEPRIELEAVEVAPDPHRRSHIDITIRYRLPMTGGSGAVDLDLELRG